jgi:hypothetical protein
MDNKIKKLTKEQQRAKRIIDSLTKYMETYSNQQGYLYYSDETIINDVLYGLGIALNRKEYEWSPGFAKFKQKLIKHLFPKVNFTNRAEEIYNLLFPTDKGK